MPRATAVLARSMTTTPCRPAGAAMDHGLVPMLLARPPHGAIAGLAFVARNDAAGLGRPAREVGRGPEVAGVADGDPADAVAAGPLDAELDSTCRDDLADPVVAVEDGDRALVAHDLRGGHTLGGTGAQPRDIPGQAQQAVGGMPPELGRDEAVGEQGRVSLRYTLGLQYGGPECGQVGSADQGRSLPRQTGVRPMDAPRR